MMGFEIRVDDLTQIPDEDELTRLLRKHSSRLARIPLSTFPWEQMPKEAPEGWDQTSYIPGLYALTYWVLKTEHHPLGELIRQYGRAKDQGVDMRQAFPDLCDFEPRLRGWLASGRIHESALDDLCSTMKLPPMMLFDERSWIAPPAYSRLEKSFRSASHQELIDLFMAFEDDDEPAPEWKKLAIKKAISYDRTRPERLQVGSSKLKQGLKEETSRDDKIMAFLIKANQARGGSPAHRRSLHSRIIRQHLKIDESIAFYRLQQLIEKSAKQQARPQS